MPKQKVRSHTTMRNNGMFCTHCWRSQAIPFPIDLDMFSAMGKQFEKTHTNCVKRWEQPWPDMALSEAERSRFWVEHGEHGSSSEFMFREMAFGPKVDDGRIAWPLDPDDFKRCHHLLKMVPELRGRMDQLRDAGSEWNNLVEHWDELAAMYEAKDEKMYARMKELVG